MFKQTSDSIDGSAQPPVIPDKAESDFLPPRTRLEATIGAERVIIPLLVAGLILFFMGFKLGPGFKNINVVSHETSLLISLWIGGGLLASAAAIRLLVDNYYVIDKASARIFLHKGLRFSGKEFPFLESHEAAAVGLNCTPVRGKYGQIGWNYTPIILTRSLKVIKLASLRTGMECDELPEFNKRTERWASALECFWIECPANQAFDASKYFDAIIEKQNPETV
jgi:hypothetical protein